MFNALRISSLIVLLLTAVNANAMGYGFYGTAISGGNAEWSRDYLPIPTIYTDINQNEIGLVMDTSVARNSLFNYRFQIANVSSSYGSSNYEGFAFNNLFGFGVWKTASLRLWLGPQIGYKEINSTNKTPETTIVGIDYGPVVGMNYHVSQSISLTSEIGYKRGFTVETRRSNDIIIYEITEDRTFINLGILFRFGNDNYH